MNMINVHIYNLCLKMLIDSETSVSDTVSQNKVDVTWSRKTFTVVHSIAFMHTHVHVATHIHRCTHTHVNIHAHLHS